MTILKLRRLTVLITTAMVTGMAVATPAAAQDFSIDYEHLSSMEKPMATEIGDMTLLLNDILDTMVIYDQSDEHAIDTGLVGNLQISALTQLPNRWRIKLDYFSQMPVMRCPISNWTRVTLIM